MKKEKTYYIYEIPGVKIGCTSNPKVRIEAQGYSDYKILETHTDIFEASDREIELQKLNGYPVDTTPYHVSATNYIKMLEKGCRKGGIVSCARNFNSEVRKSGGRTSGRMRVESGGIYTIGNFEARSRGGKNSNGGVITAQRDKLLGNPILKRMQQAAYSTKYRCPDGKVTSCQNYKRYCLNRGLDPSAAVKITA